MASVHDYLDTIRTHYDALRDTYHIQRIGIFGSTARGEQTPTSDVDVLVSFSDPPSMFRFLELEQRLSELLKRRVDLVTERALKPAIRERILKGPLQNSISTATPRFLLQHRISSSAYPAGKHRRFCRCFASKARRLVTKASFAEVPERNCYAQRTMTYTISSTPAQFPVILQEDEAGGYVASCPIFDGCFSQGDSVEEALAHITEAIQLCAEDALERGEFLNKRIPAVGLHFVTI